MKEKEKIQYTIRSVPKDVDEALRKDCIREGCSLNYAVVEALRKGAGVAGEPPIFHDLDFLSGTWVKDEACEKALEEFDRIDEELWR